LAGNLLVDDSEDCFGGLRRLLDLDESMNVRLGGLALSTVVEVLSYRTLVSNTYDRGYTTAITLDALVDGFFGRVRNLGFFLRLVTLLVLND
jgi:predicted DNA-binding ribbon-helix-helix protein